MKQKIKDKYISFVEKCKVIIFMKKLKLLSLCVALLLSVANGFAQSGTTGNLTWALSGSGSNRTLTISGNDTMPNYSSNAQPWSSYLNSITTVIISNGVTTIGDYAFYICINLTSVTIPNSVTSIGLESFGGCYSLTSIIIPDSVKTIGNYAFSLCYSLQTVNFNAINCTTMGTNVFFGDTAFRTLNIGNKVKTIPNYAFSGRSSLTSVTIPDSVTSIGDGAFSNCSGFIFVTIGNNVTTIGNYVFYGCIGLTFVTIGNSVSTIGSSAFSGCNGLTSVTIPESVTSIGSGAFQNCTNLQTVNYNAINCTTMGGVFFGNIAFKTLNIGNRVKTIPDYAFQGCDSLTSVIIPDSVTSIGDGAFASCSGLTFVIIGNNVTSVGNYAFQGCGDLTSVTIGNSVTSIGNGAFMNCISLQTVNYNAINCTTMSGNVFFGDTAFRTLNIGNKVQAIPNLAFFNLSLTGVLNIPNSVTSIGDLAFANCSSLDSVTIGNSVTNIGMATFYNCSGLASVIIGNSVTNIGNLAFYGCDSLTSITSKAMVPPILGVTAFYNVPTNIPVYVPCGSFNAYQTDTNWNYFTNFVIDSTTSVADSIFYNAVKCYNVPYTDKNFTTPINSAGTYYIRLVNNTGCDSVMCMALTENPPIPVTNYSDTICYGTTYTDNNFTNLTTSGQYYDTLQNVNGCDSIIGLTLTVNPTYFKQIKDTICQGNTYYLNGKPYTLANTYRDTLKTIRGCDSVFELNLTVNPTYFTQIKDTICNGNSYNFFDKLLTTSGIYLDTLPTIHGCDSIIELTLTVNPIYTIPIIAEICDGETYNQNGFNESISGTYTQNLKTIHGCDSTVILDLIVNPTYFTKINDSISAGSSYIFNGKTLTASGIYYDTLQTIFGCDSIFELTLTVGSVGIVEMPLMASLRVFPNPASTQLHVKLDSQEPAEYNIFSITGQILLQGKIQVNLPINIESLASGMYYLKIAGKTVKFVKE